MLLEDKVAFIVGGEQERDAQAPLGRKMGTVSAVAWAAAFLASDKAGFIAGISLPVDGGLSVA